MFAILEGLDRSVWGESGGAAAPITHMSNTYSVRLAMGWAVGPGPSRRNWHCTADRQTKRRGLCCAPRLGMLVPSKQDKGMRLARFSKHKYCVILMFNNKLHHEFKWWRTRGIWISQQNSPHHKSHMFEQKPKHQPYTPFQNILQKLEFATPYLIQIMHGWNPPQAGVTPFPRDVFTNIINTVLFTGSHDHNCEALGLSLIPGIVICVLPMLCSRIRRRRLLGSSNELACNTGHDLRTTSPSAYTTYIYRLFKHTRTHNGRGCTLGKQHVFSRIQRQTAPAYRKQCTEQ